MPTADVFVQNKMNNMLVETGFDKKALYVSTLDTLHFMMYFLQDEHFKDFLMQIIYTQRYIPPLIIKVKPNDNQDGYITRLARKLMNFRSAY